MEMLKDFPIKKYLDKKPPNDNSLTTKKEIKELTGIPIKKKYIKENDDIVKTFGKIVNEDKFVQNVINKSSPVILKIKKHHNRPRPKVLAKKMGFKMEDVELPSMKTPSYPSGHSVQGYLTAMLLADKYPNKKEKLNKAARNISYSRRVARAHYKSDSLFGEQIGKDMYKYIKDENEKTT
jgi:hypothetical protein